MKNATLIHYNFNAEGGAERVAIVFGRVLKSLGLSTTLYTFYKPMPKVLSLETFDKTEYIMPIPRGLGISYPCSLVELAGFCRKISQKCDFLVNVTPFSSPLLVGDVVYVHFPYYITELMAQSSSWKRIYGLSLHPLRLLHRALSQSKKRKKLFIFNSYYCMRITSLLTVKYGFDELEDNDAIVIYPPVEVSKIRRRVFRSPSNREDLAIVISRISPEKKLERALEIARNTKGVNFVILGRLCNPSYYSHLQKSVKKLGLTKKVKILTDVKDDEKITFLGKAKAYLHTMPYEHFGISIVEAMAAGLAPIAPNCGGPSEFLPKNLLYTNLEDAATKVVKAVHSWSKISASYYMRRAERFDEKFYSEKLEQAVGELLCS